MTKNARDVLDAFQRLSADDQKQVAVGILRHAGGGGDLSDEALTELAAEVFRAYEAEEASRGGS